MSGFGFTSVKPDIRANNANNDKLRIDRIPKNDRRRADIYALRAENGKVYDFVLSGCLGRDSLSTAIQVIPYQDEANNWPNASYVVEMSMTGDAWQALPTALSGTVTNAPGTIHMVGWGVPFYRVRVTFNSANGRVAVLTGE
jgi:hypothetical protein